MRLLLDTHTLIWAVDSPLPIPSHCIAAMADPLNDRLVSAATIWEMAIKFGKGMLPLSLPFRPWMNKAIADLALTILPITLDHADRQSELPWHHRDPFDRILAAQAFVECIPLVSADGIFGVYGLTRLWDGE